MVSILESKKVIEEVLLQREEVMGVGISPDEQRIRVYVIEEKETVPDIPKMMAGFPVEIVPIPGFVTLGAGDYRTKRFRPVPGGVSAAHTGVSAGTLGAVIRDKNTGNKLFLSNNHVFSNTTSKDNFRGHIGDPITQPGSADGGTAADTVAVLYKFVPFDDNKPNIVDAALAMPVSQDIASPYLLADDNFNMISINGVRSVSSPIKVKKYSRTSDEDWGRVLDFHFTVAVDFDDMHTRNFVDQILVEIETRGGDSGAILLDESNNAVGLIFAGGVDKRGRWYGVANKIHNVLSMLSDGEIDISDGWKPSDAMMESPPKFETETAPAVEPMRGNTYIPKDHSISTAMVLNMENDIDIHGCDNSQGYTWCDATQRCHQEWSDPCRPILPVGIINARSMAQQLELLEENSGSCPEGSTTPGYGGVPMWMLMVVGAVMVVGVVGYAGKEKSGG